MDGTPVVIPGAKPRAILTMLGLHSGSVVPADVLMELLWGDDPPRTAAKALQTHISALRHALGDGFVLTEGTGWRLNTAEPDASRYKALAKSGRDAFNAGDTSGALARFDEAVALWRGIPELPDGRPGASEKTRWIEGHAALIEDRADALLATGRAAEIIGDLEAAVAEAPLRERRWGQLMLALYRAGRQGEALGAYRRARSLLADELGVDPGPELRRLEAAIVAQDAELDIPATQHVPSVTRAVTFLLTDIEGSTAAWEADADAMALALARHDELVEQVVTSRGGRLIKTRGEGDATFSVFDRPSAAAAAAIELQDAIFHEPWELAEPMRIRVSLHTGEAELRDGDYFGRAVNRAARLRSQASGGQILCSGATAELVIDSLSDDVALVDLGMRQLKNLARPEHIFELRLQTAESRPPTRDAPIERPAMPAVLGGPGPFVGRGPELGQLLSAWQSALTGGTRAVLIAGEPGVGKTRLAGEWCRQAYEQGAVVLYGRSDEDLGAPYQPFAEALRTLVPCVGTSRLRGMRGIEALLPLVPGLSDVLPDLAAPPHGDPDTERYALFDAVVALLGIASVDVPIVLVLDDLHWAAKPTLLLLRHLLRFGEHARVQIVGTYRSTDLDRSHPLAAMLADLHRDGSANRIALGGLDEDDVSTYVAEAGYDDEELARALASVTGGNPFFLIEALRHVDESGGHWDPSTLPQGVREAVSRRLSRLPGETNKALAAAAIVGSQFALELVEQVVGQDLVDAFDEACQAGILIEEPGGRYRFNHAIVRQSLLAELASVRRMRLHQRIANTLETMPGADDELLAELAHHYFECAWAGNAVKAVEYCRRAADQAMARLAYEGAADLYDHALHALEELDDELPDRDDQRTELLVARCEALLAAGDVSSAAGAVSQLKEGTRDSARLAAWATCFDGQLSMLVDPEHLDEIESAVAAAAAKLAELGDAAGEAKAHTVRAGCLARLGRVADCEAALDNALTAARHAGEHRLVNAVLAGAPLAALWGPNPVPRAGGRCLDVVRLLRITTDSPAVEATSTRCQAVLEAFRGRAAAARRMIESARRTVLELGLRHAVLEVEHFAGIVELVLDDPAAAELHLRLAYNGFRRMGLDADTAEAAALLARACFLLDRDVEADELCSESERLAGHALKPTIAWRTVRAQLISRGGSHSEARRVAEEAVAIAERTDALVDHGDACLALAAVLGAAGDSAGARTAASRAAGLYEKKGAVALAEKARGLLGQKVSPTGASAAESPIAERDNHCLRVVSRLHDAVVRGAWAEVEPMLAPNITVENRRRIVGFERVDCSPSVWVRSARGYLDAGVARIARVVLAVRGEQLALFRLTLATADGSPGAPQDELLRLMGIDENDRVCLHVSFDLEDLDAAIAELDATYARYQALRPHAKHQVPQHLQPQISETGISTDTACIRASERVAAAIDAGAWDEFERMFAPEGSIESRRKLVGFKRTEFTPHDVVHQTRCDLENGLMRANHAVVAVRGERLALARVSLGTLDDSPGAPQDEFLQLYSIDEDGRFALQIWFDVDDMDAALAELDAQYTRFEALHSKDQIPRRFRSHFDALLEAGIAADTACVRAICRLDDSGAREAWSELDQVFAPRISLESRRRIVGFSRTEVSPSEWATKAQDFLEIGIVQIRRTLIAVRGERLALVRSVLGTADESPGAPRDELLHLIGLDVEGRINLQVSFDVEDIEAALAELDRLYTRFGDAYSRASLENTATRADDHLIALFGEGRLDEIGVLFTADTQLDDRRQGFRCESNDRTTAVDNIRAIAALDVTVTKSTLALRGDRLCLSRIRFEERDAGPTAFCVEALEITEVNSDGLMAAKVDLDPDDLDAAYAELDARYLAGEAAIHAHTWAVIAHGYDVLNHHELPPTTPDLVSIDHRHGTAFAPGDFANYVRAGWGSGQNTKTYVEVVHRLSDIGAVVTHAACGTSKDGFDAEWRGVDILAVQGDMCSRCELFDETDLDTALAKFDELSRPVRRLENAASKVTDRFMEGFADRDWDAMANMVIDDISFDDRRPVINADLQVGRESFIENFRIAADLGATQTPIAIATRGDRLVLAEARFSLGNGAPEEFGLDFLHVIEIDADHRIAATVTFDHNDFDAAVAELDARYLAGEAAAHAHTWSVITRSHAALNRRELPATSPNWVNLDHRHGAAFGPGELTAYIRAAWHLEGDGKNYVEMVHRLSDLGAVFTQTVYSRSQQGFEAEWRGVNIMMVEGELISRCELFDEADLDAALARFEELDPQVARPENTASRLVDSLYGHIAAQDWDAVAEILAGDFSVEDRRRVVGGGMRQDRDAAIASTQAISDLMFTNESSTNIATRGERLLLRHARYVRRHDVPDEYIVEIVGVAEINSDNRIATLVVFDPDDIDAAFAELDARYLAGEAAAYAEVWSAITGGYSALNRHEVPTATSDWMTIDHRVHETFQAGDLAAYIRSSWDVAPDVRIYIEAVHRVDSRGALVTHGAYGTSPEGFEAEWRMIELLAVGPGPINRCELFDEADVDAALARFDELSRPAPRLSNAASQVFERIHRYFVAGDWDTVAELLADDAMIDDRRPFVGVGARHGREAAIANGRAVADVGMETDKMTTVAIRGKCLALMRVRVSVPEGEQDRFNINAYQLVEIDTDERVSAIVVFELDDIDAALTELDARYLAGEAASHARTWSVIVSAYAALHRQEIPPLAPDFVGADHRRGIAAPPGELIPYIRARWDIATGVGIKIEALHRLSDIGTILTQAVRATSEEGFDAEWRQHVLLTVDGDLISRCEIFDESDLDSALARFDELQPQVPQLGNAASQVIARYFAQFAARDWDGLAKSMADDIRTDDRRRIANAGTRRGRDAEIANMRAVADIGNAYLASNVVADRGARLILTRVSGGPKEFLIELLSVVEINSDNQISAIVLFDLDDLVAAVAELDARYLAGEAAAHATTWSVITGAQTAFTRHEVPATAPDMPYIDHRPVLSVDAVDLATFVGAVWAVIPDPSVYIESVHRLTELGAVVTQMLKGTSRDGFDGEWRLIDLFTVEGDLISRCEVFDEADLDTALARFDELSQQPPT